MCNAYRLTVQTSHRSPIKFKHVIKSNSLTAPRSSARWVHTSTALLLIAHPKLRRQHRQSFVIKHNALLDPVGRPLDVGIAARVRVLVSIPHRARASASHRGGLCGHRRRRTSPRPTAGDAAMDAQPSGHARRATGGHWRARRGAADWIRGGGSKCSALARRAPSGSGRGEPAVLAAPVAGPGAHAGAARGATTPVRCCGRAAGRVHGVATAARAPAAARRLLPPAAACEGSPRVSFPTS